MKPLGGCLLSKSGTLLGEGVSGFEIEKKVTWQLMLLELFLNKRAEWRRCR